MTSALSALGEKTMDVGSVQNKLSPNEWPLYEAVNYVSTETAICKNAVKIM